MTVAQFTREYTTVRRAEGWGSRDSAYYQALPFRDLTGRNQAIWRIRARSYATFVEHVLASLEAPLESNLPPGGDLCADDSVVATPDVSGSAAYTFGELAGRATGPCRSKSDDACRADRDLSTASTRRRLRILDLGAGNGWLSNRLAERGHRVTAIDLLDDPLDGLGAARHYPGRFGPLLAEFDHLPMASRQMDLAIFNASLHYSTDYARTLAEALRVLHADGTLVILDSPMYSDPTSGARMVQERQARFQASYGFTSDALPSEHFLTPARLAELSAKLGLAWQLHQPGLDWRSKLSRTVGGIRARREPARFPVIVGRST